MLCDSHPGTTYFLESHNHIGYTWADISLTQSHVGRALAVRFCACQPQTAESWAGNLMDASERYENFMFTYEHHLANATLNSPALLSHLPVEL
jgi:hypothetical protein